MASHWSLSDSKSTQISRTLLSILTNLNNDVVWTVSTHPVIFKSAYPCTNPLMTVPRAPITIGITVNFMFHSFFNFLVSSGYLSLFSHSFNFTLWSTGTTKFTILQVLSFLLIIIRSGRLAKIRGSICISKSQRGLCVSFSRTDSGLWIYHSYVLMYILTACIRFPSSFFFANSLTSYMYIRWLIFSCDLLSLYTAEHFLSMWSSGIMAIMNSNGESASPWKIPLCIFVSAKILPPAVNPTRQIFMVFSIKFMTSCDILYISSPFIIQLSETKSYAFIIIIIIIIRGSSDSQRITWKQMTHICLIRCIRYIW